ncbi:MAG: 4Fe-4S dicluster domain-containing protein [Candidatus Omnitrophota bacterium]
MGKIKIRSERCKGCELCIISCPSKLITLNGPVNSMGLKTAKFTPSKNCKGCTLCAVVCPDCAIMVWR